MTNAVMGMGCGDMYWSKLLCGSFVKAPNVISEKFEYAEGLFPRYNGNISAKVMDSEVYSYSYDGNNRLTSASMYRSANADHYSTTYKYDAMSNLTSVKRRGIVDHIDMGGPQVEVYGTLDDISISYDGNRISSVTAKTDAVVFEGMTGMGRNESGMSVCYDDAGRIIADETHGISLIEYNNDGHPVRMVLDEGHEIHDVWDGLGNHLSTTIYMMQPSGTLNELALMVREYRGNGQIITSYPSTGQSTTVMTRFPGGYFMGNEVYYYVTDYQGNNIALVDGDGKIVEQTNYYPYGEPWREATEQPFLYAGNERLRLFGLNEYDFIARRYNPLLASFTTWDPIAEKYPWLSPYAYCAGNPINYIDRNGLSVHALDEETMQNIRYTLSKKEAEYVRFNNGVLDVDLLNQSESTSQNMTALKALANSVTSYIFQTGDSYPANGETKSMSENGTSGVTLMPNMGDEPSPDGNVYVHVYNRMPEEHQATTTAHEGYGHAYFYELYRKDKSIDPLHRYESEGSIYFDEEFGVYGTTSVRVDKNLKLFEQIKIVTQQALKNYKSFWK